MAINRQQEASGTIGVKRARYCLVVEFVPSGEFLTENRGHKLHVALDTSNVG